LLLLLDSSNYPVYIHCLDGQLVTSMIIMCLRKMMQWEFSSIKQEALRFLKEESSEHQEFVEKYPGEFEVNSVPPSWFQLRKHPSLKYKQSEQERTNLSVTNLERSSLVEETRLSRTIIALDLDIRT
jgi:protein tyrosine/serine phosphatase